jgi:hypothetical protein
MRDLAVVLADAGADTAGWNLLKATGISADGKVIVGDGRFDDGRYFGFVAYLP